jgi:hypothetical protein
METKDGGVFIMPQEDLEDGVYDAMIYLPKANKISKEMSEFIGGLK